MNTKRITLVTLMSACLIVAVSVSLLATSAAASTGQGNKSAPVAGEPQTDAEDIAADRKGPMSIILRGLGREEAVEKRGRGNERLRRFSV